jgi:hypothetical protein
VPEELCTQEVVLRPLSARHNPLDYDAVMASQEQLRLGNLSCWPRDGFTPAENLADLIEHEQEFAARKAFVYSILNPDETRCLGCVYINPRERVLRYYHASEAELAAVGDDEAEVDFWVRSERLADELDRRLLASLRNWLREAFAFTDVRFGALACEERQVRLLQSAGLHMLARHPMDGTEYLSFG